MDVILRKHSSPLGARKILLGLGFAVPFAVLLAVLFFGGQIDQVMRGPPRIVVLIRKTIALYLRDPAREAAEAAARGDFRLGWAHANGPMPSPSSLPGVDCEVWFRSATGKRLSTSDNRHGGDDMHQAAAYRFLTRYDQALVANAAFPYPELCARQGVRPARRYTGPVRDYGEAARAGDTDAVRRLRLAHMPGVDRRDMLGYTPLQWAMRDGNRAAAVALLEAGASANLRGPDSGGDTMRGAAPLARALLNRDDAMVRLLFLRGARMTGYTGLCDRRDDMPSEDFRCTWPGLVASRSRLDLLPAALSADRDVIHDADEPSSAFTGRDELVGVFIDASATDAALASRLIPFVKEDQPGARIAWLIAHGKTALAFASARANARDLGFSRAEAKLWLAAAINGHAETLAFLADAGGELNLLPPKRLAVCEASARAGSTMALIGCVEEAASREAAIEARVRADDLPGLLGLLKQAADLHVHGRAGVADPIIRFGPPALVRATLPLLAPLGGGREPWRPQSPPPGAALVRLSKWAGYPALQARLAAAPTLLALALARKNLAIVEAVAKAHPQAIEHQFGMLLNPMPADFEEHGDEVRVREAPPEPNRTIALILIDEVARERDRHSLEKMLQVTVAGGFDELSRAILRAGFDARRAHRPDILWSSWAGLGAPCRPSTGALLVHAGLPTAYTLDPLLNGEPPLWLVAAGCANRDSVNILAAAAPTQLRFMEEDGSTLVDVAERHRRPRMAAALRGLGVRRGSELTGRMADLRAARRRTIDWDIVQNAETR